MSNIHVTHIFQILAYADCIGSGTPNKLFNVSSLHRTLGMLAKTLTALLWYANEALERGEIGAENELSLTSRLWRYKTPQKVYTLCRLIPISPHTRRVSVVPSKCLSDAVYGQKTSAFGAWFSPNFRPYTPWVIFFIVLLNSFQSSFHSPTLDAQQHLGTSHFPLQLAQIWRKVKLLISLVVVDSTGVANSDCQSTSHWPHPCFPPRVWNRTTSLHSHRVLKGQCPG